MGSISYFTDSPPSPPSTEHVLAALDNVQTRGYHCRALLLPWPHSLCAAILEPALIRTLLPDFSFLASFQLGPASAASSPIDRQHNVYDLSDDHDDVDPRDPDPYSDPRPLHLHHPSNPNRSFALQQLSQLTEDNIMFLYPEGRDGPTYLLRSGPNARLVRAPEEHYADGDGDNDDNDGEAYTAAHRLRLYHRFPTQTPEDAVRQMITHHEEERLEITFEELIRGQDWGSHPYPLLVPGVCFRIPDPADRRRVDVMTVQRNRLLRSSGSGLSSEATGMVLGIAIHQVLADATGVDIIMSRLRREIWRE
ncbi:hypothetical protein B0H65DRAFT_507873 [Neurospora tetraspora]|uniref:Uncharacterized protein n=1 Tax=Neurospora tetraspora TaxID=94610 RepID=A0AAE0MSU5_9PEZI|nr:hypothetical protein B0H65DRAFT_507873 [Neurospora tetraspora]